MQQITGPIDATELVDATDQCIQMIRDRCSVCIHELQLSVDGQTVTMTGQIGSWHGKQLASEAAKKLFPGRRVENRLQVVRPR